MTIWNKLQLVVERIVCFTQVELLLTTIEIIWERFQQRPCLRAIEEWTFVCFQIRLQSIIDGHRYGDTRQLLPLIMFRPVMIKKR